MIIAYIFYHDTINYHDTYINHHEVTILDYKCNTYTHIKVPPNLLEVSIKENKFYNTVLNIIF